MAPPFSVCRVYIEYKKQGVKNLQTKPIRLPHFCHMPPGLPRLCHRSSPLNRLQLLYLLVTIIRRSAPLSDHILVWYATCVNVYRVT